MSIRPTERSFSSPAPRFAAPLAPASQRLSSQVGHTEKSIFEQLKKSAGDAASALGSAGVPKPVGQPPAAPQVAIPAKGVGADFYPGAPIKSVPVHGDLAHPSASNYGAVIDQFKVGSNPRYTARDGKTFCNVFATDVMLAMGATTPTPPYSVNANQYGDWLAGQGKAEGWKEISPIEAQKMANAGKPTLASWKNPEPGKSGHIAVVRPGTYDPALGPATANAGKTNFDNGHAADGFKSGPQSEIKYYVYEPTTK